VTTRRAATRRHEIRGQHGMRAAAGSRRLKALPARGRAYLACTLAAAIAGLAGLAWPASPAAGGGAIALSPVRIYPDIHLLHAAAGVPAGALTPDQIRTAYNLGPLAARGITGKGQTIVVVDSFGSPTIARDLARFDSYFRLKAPPSLRIIQPAGRVPRYRATSNRINWASETTLDVEWAHVLAPDARIVLVETPTTENEGTTGFPQIVVAEKYVLEHHLGQVISQSFAATEQTFPSKASIEKLRAVYKTAQSDHITVVAASGDEGATAYEYNMVDLYTTRAVSWPATDPLVTAVGGTQLDLRANGTRRKPDVAWSDSGGGRSIYFSRPSYQDSVAKVTGSQRGVPDISMNASCASSVAIYASFPGNGSDPWSSICGTSVATPLFAAVVALASQLAGHPLGLINPALYAMLAAHAKGIIDVTKGNNTATFLQDGQTFTVRGFAATKGYDLVCGVGTINAASFVPELARRAR
jgi:subtilase family serine protease